MTPIERAKYARQESDEAMAEALELKQRADYYEAQAKLWQSDPIAYRKEQEASATRFNKNFKGFRKQ